jgi:hypothetical protein
MLIRFPQAALWRCPRFEPFAVDVFVIVPMFPMPDRFWRNGVFIVGLSFARGRPIVTL